VNSDTAAWVAIILAAIARWLVIRFNLQTSPVNQWKIEHTLSGLQTSLNRVKWETWHDRTGNNKDKIRKQ
jgi:hypothetical protein